MDIKVHIQKNQIHHWVGDIDILQFDMRCPEYSSLPTYGMRIDFPITKQKVLAAIKAKLVIVKEQIARDNLIRQQIENMGYLDFTVTISN